jgi:quercetin dioxygenase-like cupin family protein
MRKILFVMMFLTISNYSLADGHVKRIISTSETGMGKEIVYPSGKAMITAFEFTVPVGSPVVAHTHSFPVLIMIQQGEIELTQDGKSYIYKAGDAFVEDVGVVHESKNIGNVPVKAIVVAIGVEGQKIMTPVK